MQLTFRSYFVRYGAALALGLAVLVPGGTGGAAAEGGAAVHLATAQPSRETAAIRGRARVLDADTIEVAGQRLRLYGIDAPETDQMCRDGQGRPWACGRWATAEARAVLRGARLSCSAIRQDRFGRTIARCDLPSGADLGGVLVERGVALAFRTLSPRYLEHEARARAAGLGVWAGEVQPPWEWRRARREERVSASSRTAPPDPACAIKGNISQNGRIYHLPGSLHYDRTVIDEGRGQRWFCSVAEAEAAGWRPPRR